MRSPTGGSEPPVRACCGICHRPIDRPWPAGDVHPACFAQRVSEDAFVALIALLALVLAPAIVVSAG